MTDQSITNNMIKGIGIDLTTVARHERLALRFGERYLHRVLSPGERERYQDEGAQFLAGRWCAKEALFKALHYNRHIQHLPFAGVELSSHDGAPEFQGLTETWKCILDPLQVMVSVSHEPGGMATAMVVISTKD